MKPIPPGSMVYVEGGEPEIARSLSFQLTLQPSNAQNGLLYITTESPLEHVLTWWDWHCPDHNPAGIKIIDCTESQDESTARKRDIQIEPVSDLRDLTGLGIKFSILHEHLCRSGYTPVLAGVLSATTLVEECEDLREAIRLLNMIGRRIENVGGLGVVMFDTQRLDSQHVEVLRQVCDGGLAVRLNEDDYPEFMAKDLPNQPDGWTQFQLPE